MASELLKFDKLHPFFISGGTRIDDDEYLKSLETAAELTVCTQGRKFSICFYIDHNTMKPATKTTKAHVCYKSNTFSKKT